jgi:asparagine synthase
VGTDACLFAVRVEDAGQRPAVEARVRALEAFYRPFAWRADWRWLEEPKAIVGRLAPEGDVEPTLVWGEPLPAGLDAGRLLNPSTDGLRALDRLLATVVHDDHEACVVTGAAGITAAYEATGPGTDAWATHAVAAAWLARAEVRVDPDAVPELLACEFVGDERCLVAGVRAMAPASRVRLLEGRVERDSYWPQHERWATVPEDAAAAAAETAILDGLRRRLDGGWRPALGLTGGLDSRVLAVALAELGADFDTFTWGEEDWEDVVEAQRLARALGVEHRRCPAEWLAGDAALAHTDATVRWTEGAIPVGPARPTWPPGIRAWVYGAGGETGRAYYYASHAARYRTPTLGVLARTWSPEARLREAQPEALAIVRRRARAWLEGARALGLRGWRCLDHVYAEQRVRRWGRGMVPRLDAAPVPGFVSPDVARSFLSLNDADRVTSAFHRRFVAHRRPDLAPPPAPEFRRAGRAASTARLVLAPIARAAGLGSGPRAHPPAQALAAAHWERDPGYRSWLEDEVLVAPLLVEPLGEPWAETARAGLRAGEASATDTVLRAAAAVALERALRDLRPT